MNKYTECKIVAEVAGNHAGKMETAKKLIEAAKLCGADYVKFQKRNPKESVPKNIQNKPHPNPMHSFGNTYLEHRVALELNLKQHRELKRVCDNIGIGYSCSVWDLTSAKEIISLNPNYVKIPSAMNNNYELMKFLYNEYSGDIHISLGMATKKERKEILEFAKTYLDRTVFYWTTSGYPVPFDELYLLEIKDLARDFPRTGFSGHHLGISADIAAYVLGATWVERHFTLDRTAKGTDHAASLESGGLQKLVRDLKAAQQALSYKDIDMTNDEIQNRVKLKVD